MGSLLLLALLWGVEWAQGQWGAGGERAGIQGQGPRINIQAPDPVMVQEGLCVLVPCSFYYPWSSQNYHNILTYWFRGEGNHLTATLVATNYYWNKVKPEIAGRFKLLSDSTNSCSLSITDARKEDQGAYFFRVERGNDKYNYKEKKLNLQVTAQPDIDFEKPLVSGQPARLTCIVWGYCDGKAPLFSWLGDALDSLRSKIKNSQVLSFTPRLQDHGSNLTCQVKVPQAQVSTERTIRLNVSYAPRFLTATLSQGNHTALRSLSHHSSVVIQEGQSVRLVCAADSNPPARLSWSLDGRVLSPSEPSEPGVLELPHAGPGEQGQFTCQAHNQLGTQHLSFSLSLQGSLPPCTCAEQEQGSWPLVLTLIRGGLMGAGFLLTYGLTWIYYTRCPGSSSRQN
ncbi:sialic acid-binding Ig-like lectin 14 [Erinaceus europaeus]|uniref:Sialic acid-binding Ig-like lectin 14 n=1 Tax=Erinaceus europaeus TaxID=9365 RepID=A0ABM3W4T7_ERIEU|nr:sialic acid-binding Ig-like lectin 14 [Erinaceus europaeus]XP_060031456.1 sialic acid-binding Ig-like lectin 14 [Erinaceus europaeus]